MIQNYFRMIHIIIEKIITGDCQLPYDLPARPWDVGQICFFKFNSQTH